MVMGSNPARAVPLKLSSSGFVDLLRRFMTCNGSLHVVRVRKMPHQNIRLDIILSDSGQDCVDLSPIENYNFGWGPSFTE